MHDKLISYLLGDLSPEEAVEIERQAADDPALADQIEQIRTCLEGQATGSQATGSLTDEAVGNVAPPGLAHRTADSVSMLALGLQDSKASGPSGRCTFSMLDAVVAIGVVAAVAMLLVPALRESRESARRAKCANQLREIGYALREYTADKGGYFPMPPEGGNAGSFTIILADNGYLPRRRLSINVVCPGSPDADLVAQAKLLIQIPTFDELKRARGEELGNLRRVMALSYAYRSPYQRDGELLPIRNADSHRAPVLADAPTLVDGQWRNVNHGCGLNVLFQDGSVRYLVDCREPVCQDHFFVNAEGRPAPPTQTDDAVLMRSEDVLRVTPVSRR